MQLKKAICYAFESHSFHYCYDNEHKRLKTTFATKTKKHKHKKEYYAHFRKRRKKSSKYFNVTANEVCMLSE